MEPAVQGHVAVKNGEAFVKLTPVLQPYGAPRGRAPPVLQPDMISSWTAHPSRQPVTRDTLTQAIVAVQKQLGIATGIRAGAWSDDADQRLRVLLWILLLAFNGSSGAGL